MKAYKSLYYTNFLNWSTYIMYENYFFPCLQEFSTTVVIFPSWLYFNIYAYAIYANVRFEDAKVAV